MRKFSTYKHFLVGCVVGSMLISGVAAASDGTLTNVLKGSAKFLINQVDRTPSDNVFFNGSKNVPASVIYEGTTYIPIRMVSNMLNVPINWDGKSKTILVGTSVYDGAYLTDTAPSLIDDYVYINSKEYQSFYQIDGQSYDQTIALSSRYYDTRQISYNLNGQYDTFSFLYGGNQTSTPGTLEIYSEGELLWTGQNVSGVKGQDVSLDVKGLMSIDIVYTSSGKGTVVIANPFVSKSN